MLSLGLMCCKEILTFERQVRLKITPGVFFWGGGILNKDKTKRLNPQCLMQTYVKVNFGSKLSLHISFSRNDLFL